MNKEVIPVAQDYAKKAGGYVIEDIYKEFIKPKLNKIKNKPKNAYIIFEMLEKYYEKAYDRYKYMNTIVFKKETKTIDELYIPLTIVKNGKSNREKIVIDDNMPNIFQKCKRILLIDLAGMGKSTVLKYMYLKWLRSGHGIPFLIELRRLEKEETILRYICREMCLYENKLNENDIRFLIENGEFVFFLDGYDEIAKENKYEITQEIQKFVLEFGDNNYMISSREEEALNSFREFEKYHIRPLNKEEAYELIRKYDQYGTVAEDLINEIEDNEQYEILEEFLENPLMISLLYLTYHYKGKIQYKKYLFYRQVYDALYEGHDITKGDGNIHKKKTGLDIDGFNNLLSAMGYMSVHQGKISYGKTELKKMIQQALELYWSEECINVNDVIHDVLYAVPVFVEEGIEFKWTHKSFAEYFAANFICSVVKEREASIINSIMESNNNMNLYNVLDFCYDMDYKLANEVIVYNVISRYLDYRDNYKQTINDEFDVLTCYYKWIFDVVFAKMNIKGKKKMDATEIIKAFGMTRKIFENAPDGILSVSNSQGVIGFIYYKPIYCVIKLLYGKCVDIFSEIKCKEFSMKFWSELEENAYLWNDNENPILTNADAQKAIISYIHHKNYSFSGFILDYDKCKTLKKKIEKNRLKVDENIFAF